MSAGMGLSQITLNVYCFLLYFVLTYLKKTKATAKIIDQETYILQMTVMNKPSSSHWGIYDDACSQDSPPCLIYMLICANVVIKPLHCVDHPTIGCHYLIGHSAC